MEAACKQREVNPRDQSPLEGVIRQSQRWDVKRLTASESKTAKSKVPVDLSFNKAILKELGDGKFQARRANATAGYCSMHCPKIQFVVCPLNPIIHHAIQSAMTSKITRPYYVDALNHEEKRFLTDAGIPMKDVFIHPHIAVNRWPGIMRALGMAVAWGPPCRKSGHKLRSRSNHCAMCSPGSLSYQQSYSDPAIVYVANSRTLNLVKIGISKTLERRITKLNSQRLGGASDWTIQFQIQCDNAATVEERALRLLKGHRSYSRFATRKEISRETIRYPVEKAVAIMSPVTSKCTTCGHFKVHHLG